MPLAKKKSPVLPDSLKNQIQSNFSRDEENECVREEPVTEDAGGKGSAGNGFSGGRYADCVNLRLSKGKRSEFKKFFTQCEISMNQGFEAAVDFLIEEVKAGRVRISKSGISRNQF